MASSPAPAPSARRLAVPAAVTLASIACAGAAAYQLVTAGWNPGAGAPADPAGLAAAAWFILLAQLFDILDGVVARALRATSPFGLQLDSLADFLSFGAVPALLLAVAGDSVWASIAALGVVGCAAVRVARYNVEKPPAGTPLHFKGLVTPGVGGAIASWVLLSRVLADPPAALAPLGSDTLARVADGMLAILPLLGVLLAALMVSDRRYPDVTKFYARGLAPWWPPVALVAIGLVTAPAVPFAVFYLGYAVWGLTAGPFERPTPASEAA
jgi:CDP-diacylglycerol--serine O-phosphatidyltransferase